MMDEEYQFITMLYFLITFLLFIFWCFWQSCYTTNDPLISNSYLNQIQVDNGYLTSINRDQQRSLVPLNALNDLEYEYINNPLSIQPHQPYNTEQISRINISSPQAIVVSLSSSLNYMELNASNVISFSRSQHDDPPPSYDECMASSRSTP